MNERENAIESHRLSEKVCGLLLCACVMLSGCAIANETSRVLFMAKRTTHIEPRFYRYMRSDRRAQKEARKLGQQAWNDYAANHPDTTPSPDFENGFIEGFADYLYRGGSGEPPAIPPRGYWNLRFLNQYGKASTKDWYEGFRQGARDCKARGIRELWVIPTSLYASVEESSGHEALPPVDALQEHGLSESLATEISSAIDAQTSPLDPPPYHAPPHEEQRQIAETPRALDPTREVDVTVPEPPPMSPEPPIELPPVIEGLAPGEELRVDDSLSIRALLPATRIPVETRPALNAAVVAPAAGVVASPTNTKSDDRIEIQLSDSPDDGLRSEPPQRMKLVFEGPTPASPDNTQQGGEVGSQNKNSLQPELEPPFIRLKRNPSTNPIPTRRDGRAVEQSDIGALELPMRIQAQQLERQKADVNKPIPQLDALKMLLEPTDDALLLPRIVNSSENRKKLLGETSTTPPIRWRIRD